MARAIALEAIQKQINKLLKAILKYFENRLSGGPSIDVLKGSIGYPDQFKTTFQQNPGIKELNDETLNLFNSTYVACLSENIST